ncbi:MAG: hypothetical protein Q7K55_01580, partial [Candidatus Levybacteria bacterium]|nr:hypothetical protein [Candidatus Levybacteria bacterium]
MKKISLIILSIVLFVLAYQVRTGFLLSKDYNNPGDSHEYMGAAANAAKAAKGIDSLNTFIKEFPVILNAFDLHSAPATIAYYTLINLLMLDHNRINILLSSLFVVFLFLLLNRLFSLWVAMIVSIFSVVYTPLYSLIYSFMPERFGSFYIPIMIVLAVYSALRAPRSLLFAILTGTFLGLASLYRIEARWIGFPFVTLWMIVYFKNKIYSKRRIIAFSIIIFMSYFFWAGGWMIVSKLVNNNPYYTASSAAGVLYNTYNYSLYGWSFSSSPVHTIPDLVKQITPQGPVSLLWLQLAQIIRLWFRPATAYAGEYLIPDTALFIINYMMIGLAVLGFRRIFREKKFLFLFIPLFWISLVSFIPEDIRRQVPLIGLMLIFTAAGIDELYKIFINRRFRTLGFLLILAFIAMVLGTNFLTAIFSFIYPKYLSIAPLRIFNWLLLLILFIKITKMFLRFDKKNKECVFKKMRLVPAFVTILIFLFLSWYSMRSPAWHEWTTNLKLGDKLEQHIDISPSALSELNNAQGYLLVDMKSANVARDISVSLNGQVIDSRLTLKDKYSPVDLLVLRQFQRGMPRLGFGNIEDSVASLSAFPNRHEWLITRIHSKDLQTKNTIIIEKGGSLASDPIIYGDYYSEFAKGAYEGPTARIFQGAASFLKLEVDGDIRLPERVKLFSSSNNSVLYVNGKTESDLSNGFGIQTGRYRIFFL